MLNLKTNLKQINDKKILFNLYKDIVLVTRVQILCTTLFTNNNIKIVIKSHTFLFHQFCKGNAIIQKFFQLIYAQKCIKMISVYKVINKYVMFRNLYLISKALKEKKQGNDNRIKI